MARINRRTALKLGAFAALAQWRPLFADTDAALRHPGLLHTAGDFARMKEKVAGGVESWKAGWEKLIASRMRR